MPSINAPFAKPRSRYTPSRHKDARRGWRQPVPMVPVHASGADTCTPTGHGIAISGMVLGSELGMRDPYAGCRCSFKERASTALAGLVGRGGQEVALRVYRDAMSGLRQTTRRCHGTQPLPGRSGIRAFRPVRTEKATHGSVERLPVASR